MDIDISGRVIVITGAAQGIGRSLALGLAAEGARVAVLARDRGRAQDVADEIGRLAAAPAGPALGADVGDEPSVMRAAAEVGDAAAGASSTCRAPPECSPGRAAPPTAPPRRRSPSWPTSSTTS